MLHIVRVVDYPLKLACKPVSTWWEKLFFPGVKGSCAIGVKNNPLASYMAN